MEGDTATQREQREEYAALPGRTLQAGDEKPEQSEQRRDGSITSDATATPGAINEADHVTGIKLVLLMIGLCFCNVLCGLVSGIAGWHGSFRYADVLL